MNDIIHMKKHDLAKVFSRVPYDVYAALKELPHEAVLAGGFIRDIYAGLPCKDADIFIPQKGLAGRVMGAFPSSNWTEVGEVAQERSHDGALPAQVIWAREFATPEFLISQFDFICCQAAVWIDPSTGLRAGAFHRDFVQHCLDKRLKPAVRDRYTPASTLLRAVKFTARGWNIGWSELAGLVARVSKGRDEEEIVARFKAAFIKENVSHSNKDED